MQPRSIHSRAIHRSSLHCYLNNTPPFQHFLHWSLLSQPFFIKTSPLPSLSLSYSAFLVLIWIFIFNFSFKSVTTSLIFIQQSNILIYVFYHLTLSSQHHSLSLSSTDSLGSAIEHRKIGIMKVAFISLWFISLASQRSII